ncbi:hypothetical protein GCM10011533_12620 [Streptosporangium jomthongense]|nr:hypothetical protein GCM10011533_12620 [Streptosporangium jomthongense]
MPDLLVASDIMIVPSVWEEAFGFTILEAMSVGIPLVVSKVGGIPELVEDSFNGLVVEKASSDEIAAAIITLINNPRLREEFSKNGVAKSIDKFSIVDQCQKIFSSYQKSLL